MSERSLSRTTSGVVSAQPGYYTGYVVTTGLSAAEVTIYDNATTNSGTIIDIIPASSGVGIKGSFNRPVRAANGLYAQFGGTGTVTFLFD